eukprot:1192034-Prorocentrum_minimum.AAC.3
MHSRGATSSAPVKRQPPGEPVKQVPVLNPGLARHPGDDQEESFLGSTHHHQQTSSSSFRTKTNNTYFHRMLQRGNAQERRVWLLAKQDLLAKTRAKLNVVNSELAALKTKHEEQQAQAVLMAEEVRACNCGRIGDAWLIDSRMCSLALCRRIFALVLGGPQLPLTERTKSFFTPSY